MVNVGEYTVRPMDPMGALVFVLDILLKTSHIPY